MSSRTKRQSSAATSLPFCNRWANCRPRSGADAGPDRAADAGPAEAAVPVRVLRQVLLVIILGEIERRAVEDLGGDGPVALRPEGGVIRGLGGGRGLPLLAVG